MCETSALLEGMARSISLRERLSYLVEQNPELNRLQLLVLSMMSAGNLTDAADFLEAEAATVRSHNEYKEADPVNRPNHYAKWKLEPTKWAREFNVNWNVANAVKYIFRYQDKMKPKEDLLKAARYLTMEANFLAGDERWSQ